MRSQLLLANLILVLLAACLTMAIQSTTKELKKNDMSYREIKNDRQVAQGPSPKEKRSTTHYKNKPGFFRTLFSVIYEQWSDTKNTINKVQTLINDNFLPEDAAQQVTTTPANINPNVSTTAAPYRITRSEFNRILRRNFRGLVRLFNIEYRDALKESKKSKAEFQKNLGKEISKFL